MAHIHSQPGAHDFTAAAYIVLRQAGSPDRVWLHRHRKLGIWLHYGGHVELSENPWQTLWRELSEESGYAADQLQVLQPKGSVGLHASDGVFFPLPAFLSTHRYGNEDHFHNDIAFALITSELPRHTVAAHESQEHHAFTADELRQIPTGSVPENVRVSALSVLATIVNAYTAVDAGDFPLTLT